MNNSGLEVYAKCLENALSADKSIRQTAEAHLRELQKSPDFLQLLVLIILMDNVSEGVRVNAAILLKNKITHVWLLSQNSESNPSIRKELCNAIYKTHQNTSLRKQLTEALYKTLVVEQWPELADISLNYLSSSNFGDVYTGLLLAFQLIKSKRWSRGQDSVVLHEHTAKLFPSLSHLAENFVHQLNSSSSSSSNEDLSTSELLYLILKIFKYATFTELPPYFNDPNHLGKWIEIQLNVISSPLPVYLGTMDDEERTKHFRVKAVKWSYANIHRLQYKYGGGLASSKKDNMDFVKFFNTQFVPVILQTYWKEIFEWSNKTKWLSESSLYYLISFLEACCSVDESWNLINEKMDAIFNHLVLPSLAATDASLEMFEDEPEEYYRTYLDINKEVRSADVAAINFVFNLGFSRFDSVISLILNLLNDIFSKRSSDFNNLDYAKQLEAGFRLLSSISFRITKKNSPVIHQIDQMINSFVVPELSVQNKFTFLKARACNVIASFSYSYKDKQVLSHVYEGCMTCFQRDDSLPLQITSADALGTLITEEEVQKAIVPHVTLIMEKLLNLSNTSDFDVINSIMDDFVEMFSEQLEPFSIQIASNLNQQLIRVCTQLLEHGNMEPSSEDVDKEYQGIGILNTMMTMILSMNSSNEITIHLMNEYLPSIKFIMENASVNFIAECMELLESVNVTLKKISPLMWDFFQLTLESFDTYGEEYYELYIPFLESCINYGFKDKMSNIPQFTSLLKMIDNNVRPSNEDFLAPTSTELSLELLYKVVLTVEDISEVLPHFLRLSTKLYFESDSDTQEALLKSFLKLLLSSMYKDPNTTLKTFSEDEVLQLFKLWFDSASLFKTSFDLKLEIVVVICLLKLIYSGLSLPQLMTQLESNLKMKLLSSLQKLPTVVAKQLDILSRQNGDNKQIFDYKSGDDYINDQLEEYEYDLEEADLYKDILFDHLNVYDEFVNKFLKTGDIYNQFIKGISDPELINVVNECISAVQQTK